MVLQVWNTTKHTNDSVRLVTTPHAFWRTDSFTNHFIAYWFERWAGQLLSTHCHEILAVPLNAEEQTQKNVITITRSWSEKGHWHSLPSNSWVIPRLQNVRVVQHTEGLFSAATASIAATARDQVTFLTVQCTAHLACHKTLHRQLANILRSKFLDSDSMTQIDQLQLCVPVTTCVRSIPSTAPTDCLILKKDSKITFYPLHSPVVLV